MPTPRRPRPRRTPGREPWAPAVSAASGALRLRVGSRLVGSPGRQAFPGRAAWEEAPMIDNSHGVELFGRDAERQVLDGIAADAHAGRSRVVVLWGEAGVGKSALLGYLTSRVTGWHIATAVGVESEMELAYSGLHQLCAPMLERLDH